MEIKRIEVIADFKYLWLKTVEDVDLSVHCARCLKGKYDNRIKPFKGVMENLVLEDSIFYLCGVSSPYRWERNFHMAFKPCKGKNIEVNENGIIITILDAERIPITPDFIDVNDPNSRIKAFSTCRNWQFANYLKNRTTLG